MSFQSDLPNRIPEYYQGENLDEYLDLCGEIFDEYADNIRAIDYFKDYKKSPSTRLNLVARRFSFNVPARLPDDVLRGIIRDLTSVYKTTGILKTIQWIMKILSWDATIENLWLIFPEKYQPKVRDVYSQFYTEPNLVAGASKSGAFFPLIGQSYRAGVPFQNYFEDTTRIVDGDLRIGANSFIPEGVVFTTDPFDASAGFAEFYDVGRIDKTNFVTGQAVYTDTGVYFRGRTQFSDVNNLFDLRILGETYPLEHIRKPEVVMKTPYLAIEITSDDYDKFVADSSYTENEKYQIAQELIKFLLYDLFRPLNVKYLSLVAPLGLSDAVVSAEDFTSSIEFPSPPFVPENEYYYPDAPSYQHFDSNMAINPDFIPETITLSHDHLAQEYYEYEVNYVPEQSTTPYQFNIAAMTFVADSTEYVSSDVIQLRTPSVIQITTSDPIVLEYLRWRNSSWVQYDGSSITGTTTYETRDMYAIRFRSAIASPTVSLDVTWLDQSSRDINLPFTPELLPV